MRLTLLLFASLLLLVSGSARALDRVVFRPDGGQPRVICGRLVVSAQDGGLLVLTPAGILWAIQPDEIVDHSQDERPFAPLTAAPMAALLRTEQGDGFQVHKTDHYVVCHNTSPAYARWCGGLLERLYGAFLNFWRRRGFKLHDPETPLVAMLFADASSYRAYAQAELADAASSVVGYYSLRTNRTTSYDLTGVQALSGSRGRRGSRSEINRMLAQPTAEPLVATLIHEATHQIAFNCGLLTRYADIPLWVSEGIAIYFETPDLKSASGWRSIGKLSRSRLGMFRRSLPDRDPRSLERLIADDSRLRDVSTAAEAYAEAWALNDFLIHQRSKQYLKYLTRLSLKQELVWDDSETRLADFKQCFGEAPGQMETQFLRHVQRLLEKAH